MLHRCQRHANIALLLIMGKPQSYAILLHRAGQHLWCLMVAPCILLHRRQIVSEDIVSKLARTFCHTAARTISRSRLRASSAYSRAMPSFCTAASISSRASGALEL
jgi:hypothetical protein